MRKNKNFLIILILSIVMCYGCQTKQLIYSNLYRDDFNTGGNLTFVYDDYTHTAYIGGKDEVIAYYDENIAKGWDEQGNRIGIKLFIPKDLENFQSSTAYINEKKLESKDFYVYLDDGRPVCAQFFPIVDNETREIKLKIKWTDEFEEQTYNIKIVEGTILAKKSY